MVTEPDPTTLAIVRRFTDQAGLALEQVERRRAEEEAARRADETRRLQEITAALAIASTAADVSTTCLEHALEAVGAEAGFVVLTRPESVAIDLVTSSGYEEDEVARWGGLALDDDVPFARAISSGEAVWAFTADDVASFTGASAGSDTAWAVLPLKTAAGVRGALHLAFRSPRELGEDERRWLQAIVSQCAQALERSRLFDAEQLLRRRSERLQAMTAALSTALTRADVANIVVDEVGDAVSADGAALAEVVVERGRVTPLAMRGYPEDVPLSWLEVSPDVHTPASRTLERRASAFYESLDDLRTEFPDVADDLARLGHESFLFVPLVAGRRANTVLVVSWEQPGLRSRSRSGASWSRSSARPRRRSIARRASRPSRRSPRRSSAACSRCRFRASTASTSPRATCRAPPGSTSAGTGSTPFPSPTAGSGSSSETSSERACRRLRRWHSSGTRCVPSRSIA